MGNFNINMQYNVFFFPSLHLEGMVYGLFIWPGAEARLETTTTRVSGRSAALDQLSLSLIRT